MQIKDQTYQSTTYLPGKTTSSGRSRRLLNLFVTAKLTDKGHVSHTCISKVFIQRCLSKILRITYQEHAPNEVILKQCNIERLTDIIMRHRIRLFGTFYIFWIKDTQKLRYNGYQLAEKENKDRKTLEGALFTITRPQWVYTGIR